LANDQPQHLQQLRYCCGNCSSRNGI